MSAEGPISVLDSVAKGDEKPLPQLVEAFSSHVTSQPDDLEDVLWDSWNHLFDIVKRTSSDDQDRLVEFLVLLREFEVKDAQGEKKVYEVGDGTLWSDLPVLGWVARDEWNFDVREPNMTQESLNQCANKTAFLARLTSRSTRGDPLDFSLYALWALREAFEEECPAGHNLEPAIRNAALWINYAGKELGTLAVQSREFSGRMAVPGKKFADREWKGFNGERWGVWRAAFEEAGSSAEAEETAP